ncbi:hypothetical protein BHS04_21060 [Myxococcus xanthus]|nr:hypothetical protein BHS04_21060 [Myxococcus xanthus]
MRAAETVRADILGEFIVRHAGTNWFFQTALTLEAAAYHKRFTPIAQLPLAAQSVIGLLLDFHEIDRHILFGIND